MAGELPGRVKREVEKDINAVTGEAAGGSEGVKKASLSDELAARRTDLASDRTDMAIARTSMAADRTLMSWVRTSLSLMSFGFTIYKFLTYIIQLPGNSVTQLSNPDGPRQLGIIMVSASLLCVLLGMIEYRDIYRRFGRQRHQRLWGTSLIMAVLIALLSLLLLLAIITKIGGL